jgi:hypothetical protein
MTWKYEFVDFLSWTCDVSRSVEIYCQKQIPKDLAGKPDGWNRNLLPPYGIFVLSCFSKCLSHQESGTRQAYLVMINRLIYNA